MTDLEQYLEILKIRKEKYLFLKIGYWICILLWAGSIAAIFMKFDIYHKTYMLLFGLGAGNGYFLHNLATDKIGDVKLMPIIMWMGIVGFNIVILGILFGFIK